MMLLKNNADTQIIYSMYFLHIYSIHFFKVVKSLKEIILMKIWGGLGQVGGLVNCYGEAPISSVYNISKPYLAKPFFDFTSNLNIGHELMSCY